MRGKYELYQTRDIYEAHDGVALISLQGLADQEMCAFL